MSSGLSLLLANGGSSYLAGPVGYQPFHFDPVTGVKRYHFIKLASHPLRFVTAQMAFGTLNSHNFTATGNVEAAFCPFVGFQFRHSKFPLPLLSL